ncbi:DUF6087 family protein [Streptomyces endocoffeicus]|uniref:DUF6087 family protein n=1 Tax=Streptomyces endocoffeicus TaxID=2898945 RepID=UPI0022AB2E39|nr:DUF6087 family protein [Streptomyces endocoffeicus]
MGKHRRPGPPNQPSRVTAQVDTHDPLAAYFKRRRAPMDQYRRHRPLHGGGGHLHPSEARVLEEWTDFACEPVGTAPDLAAAQAWVHAQHPGSGTSLTGDGQPTMVRMLASFRGTGCICRPGHV